MARRRRKGSDDQPPAPVPEPAAEQPAALASTVPPPPPREAEKPDQEYVCVYRLSGAVKGAIGSTVRLPAAEAERLLRLGAIRPVK